MFKIFSVETRIKIVELLKNGKALGAKDIAGKLKISPAAASQHLKVLRTAGLVKSARNGFYVPYSLDAGEMEKCRVLLNKVCQCGCKSSCRFEEKKETNLRFLEEYRKKLEKELAQVTEKIESLRNA